MKKASIPWTQMSEEPKNAGIIASCKPVFVCSSLQSVYRCARTCNVVRQKGTNEALAADTKRSRNPFSYSMMSGHKTFCWSLNLLIGDKIVYRFLQRQTRKKKM